MLKLQLKDVQTIICLYVVEADVSAIIGDAFAPPFAIPRILDLCGFMADTYLTIGRGVQR